MGTGDSLRPYLRDGSSGPSVCLSNASWPPSGFGVGDFAISSSTKLLSLGVKQVRESSH